MRRAAIFSDGPDVALPGEPYTVEMLLPYYPAVTYDALVPGVTFTIREGAVHIVGHGVVLSREDPVPS